MNPQPFVDQRPHSVFPFSLPPPGNHSAGCPVRQTGHHWRSQLVTGILLTNPLIRFKAGQSLTPILEIYGPPSAEVEAIKWVI